MSDRREASGRTREPSRSSSRVDQPISRRRFIPRPQMDSDAFGQFAETFARFMGTARFLVYMTLFVAVWIAWNVMLPESVRFDPYAFIFLTLMLSLQASYAAPLILLAQNRQADRDRVTLEQDRARDERNLADTEYLTREVASLRLAVGDTVTRDYLRGELRNLLEELDERNQVAKSKPKKKRKGPKANKAAVDAPVADAQAPAEAANAQDEGRLDSPMGAPAEADGPDGRHDGEA